MKCGYSVFSTLCSQTTVQETKKIRFSFLALNIQLTLFITDQRKLVEEIHPRSSSSSRTEIWVYTGFVLLTVIINYHNAIWNWIQSNYFLWRDQLNCQFKGWSLDDWYKNDINSDAILGKYSKLSRYYVLLNTIWGSFIILVASYKKTPKLGKMQKRHYIKIHFEGWMHPHQFMLTIYFFYFV